MTNDLTFGQPPVLRSENRNAYDAIMKRFTECLKPQDFIEQMFVWDLTNSTWDIIRYSRHKTLVIEREHHRHQEKEDNRQDAYKIKKAIAERATEETGPAKQADQAGTATTQFDRMVELEDVVDRTIFDVDQIVALDESIYARALQSGIDYFERLDRLMSVSMARRNDVLGQIELYRQGLGQHLRRVSDEIIDAEFSETQHEAPPLAGADGGAQ